MNAKTTLIIIVLAALVILEGIIIRDHSRQIGQIECRLVMFEDGSTAFQDGEVAMRCLNP